MKHGEIVKICHGSYEIELLGEVWILYFHHPM